VEVTATRIVRNVSCANILVGSKKKLQLLDLDPAKVKIKKLFAFKLSNVYSPANLANSSTRQNGLFEKLVGLAKFAYICQPGLLGLARLADIHQPSFLGLARLAKAKFCK
jgi:hypothetical protein